MIYFFLFLGSFSLINGLLIIFSNSYNAWIDRNIKNPATAVKPAWMRSADDWLTKKGARRRQAIAALRQAHCCPWLCRKPDHQPPILFDDRLKHLAQKRCGHGAVLGRTRWR